MIEFKSPSIEPPRREELLILYNNEIYYVDYDDCINGEHVSCLQWQSNMNCNPPFSCINLNETTGWFLIDDLKPRNK